MKRKLALALLSIFILSLCIADNTEAFPWPWRWFRWSTRVSPASLELSLDTSDARSRGTTTWWYDLSGNAAHVTQSTSGYRPTISGADKLSGSTRVFDGTDDNMSLTARTVTSWTVETWYKTDSVSGRYPILDQGDFFLRQWDDDLDYGFLDDSYIDRTSKDSTIFSTNTWYHLAATKSGNDVTLYLDGSSSDTFSSSATLQPETNLIIGADSRTAFIYPSLTPANLTSEKGILINASDLIEYGKGSNSLDSATVTENWNGNQITIRVVVESLNFVPGDGMTHYILDNQGTGTSQNRVQLYFDTAGLLTFVVHDKDSTQHLVSYDTTGWSVGTTYHIVARLDFKNNEIELYTDGTSRDSTPDNALSSDSIDTIEANMHFGKDTNDINQLNGVGTIQVFNRSWSDAEVLADWNSGNGVAFVVDPDTILMAAFSDDETGAVYWHRGKTVSAISAGGTEATLTTATGADDVFADGDAVTISDGAGWFKEGFVDGTPASATELDVDDGAGGAVAGIDEVGKSLEFDGSESVGVNGLVNDIQTDTVGSFSIWVQPNSLSGYQTALAITKANGATAIRFGLNNATIHTAARISGTWQWRANTTNNLLTVDTWSHIVLVQNGTIAKIYVNGIEEPLSWVTTTDQTVWFNDNPDFDRADIGTIYWNNSFNEYMDGQIDGAQIYTIALTPADVLWLSTHPHPTLAEIFANTSATENGGAANDDIVLYHNYRNGDLVDLSEYSNDGTHSGTPTYTTSAYISKNHLSDPNMENGSIGGWTVGDAATTISKDTSTVKFDTQSLKILNGDGTQAFTRQTITTVAGNEYWFHAWFYSPATPNSASQLVNVDAAAALGVTVTQAGVTSGTTWYEIEFCFEAADASATIDLGSGSVINTEAGYWDSVELRTQRIDASGFETNIAGSSWSQTGTPAVDDADADERSGALCYNINGDSSNYLTQDVTVVSGQKYTFMGWVKCGSADTGIIDLSGAATATLDNGSETANYIQVKYSFEAATTTLTIKIYGDGAVARYDDFVLLEVDEAAASTAARTRDFVDGSIEKVRVWSRALSGAEIQRQFNKERKKHSK